MNLINRGIVGSWKGGGRKVLGGAAWLGFGLAIIAILIWGIKTQTPEAGSVGVLFAMWILSAGDSGVSYLLSWVFDSEEIV